jgi:hypothetical protein
MVTITVGKDSSQKTFHMYRGLLCFHSEYFKKLFEGGFREAQSDTHTMPETDVNIFELFYAWVCTGTIDKFDRACDSGVGYDTISQLYAFADYLMAEELKNLSVELFFFFTLETRYSCFLSTQDLYDRTAENCSLRRLHVDVLLARFKFPDFREHGKDLPIDFIVDLFEAGRAKGAVYGKSNSSMSRLLWATDMKTEFCKVYHEHTDIPTGPA